MCRTWSESQSDGFLMQQLTYDIVYIWKCLQRLFTSFLLVHELNRHASGTHSQIEELNNISEIQYMRKRKLHKISKLSVVC